MMEVNNQNRLVVWLGKMSVYVKYRLTMTDYHCCSSDVPASVEVCGGGECWQHLLQAGRSHGLQVELPAERLHQGRL